MSRRIPSPSSRWPGSVVFADPMTLPQALAWERAEQAARPLRIQIAEAIANKNFEMVDVSEAHTLIVPGILACVEKWELEGFPEFVTADNFPVTPRVEGLKLISWLTKSIGAIYDGEEDKAPPNE